MLRCGALSRVARSVVATGSLGATCVRTGFRSMDGTLGNSMLRVADGAVIRTERWGASGLTRGVSGVLMATREGASICRTDVRGGSDIVTTRPLVARGGVSGVVTRNVRVVGALGRSAGSLKRIVGA